MAQKTGALIFDEQMTYLCQALLQLSAQNLSKF